MVGGGIKIFIGSSTRGLPLANAIQANLSPFDCTIWNQDVFALTKSTLDNLISALESFDFGIFVFSADDEVHVGGQVKLTARDNVIFELGLFTGGLGRERALIVEPDGIPNFHSPTDLMGMTTARFPQPGRDGNLRALLGPACDTIRKHVLRVGPINRSTGRITYVAAVCYRQVAGQLEFLLVKSTRQRWVLPKGRVKAGETLTSAAQRYAHDEGGVSGIASSEDLLMFKHHKEEEGGEQNIAAFLLEVSDVGRPVDRFRHPKWFSLEKAKSEITKGRTYTMAAEMQRVLCDAAALIGEKLVAVHQVAALPCRNGKDGKEILLVTSKGSGRWIIPKGNIGKKDSPLSAAAKEAWEEAGIRGRMSNESVGSYFYRRLNSRFQVELFVLWVEEEADEWPDMAARQRKWFSRAEAAKMVDDIDLRRIVADLT
jgi:8-oxo-dGTP pyrophosphatase MutT (NUDIX family)